MARTINRITLVGNVGRDPDMGTNEAGEKYAWLTLSTNRWLPAHEEDESAEIRTDWHRLYLTGRFAQYAESHLQAGDRIYVEGALEYGSYERDAVVIPTAQVNVSQLMLLSRAERSWA